MFQDQIFHENFNLLTPSIPSDVTVQLVISWKVIQVAQTSKLAIHANPSNVALFD